MFYFCCNVPNFCIFQGESTDNFNWGVRRRPLSGADFDGDLTLASQAADSLSEKTPLLTIRTVS